MKPESLFSAERPIEKLADDQLSRSGFAIAMARTIAAWRDRESLVLAIYGPWGSGKSSLRNMILDALAQDKAKTIHFEFNPWEWSGQDKVLEGFFGELSAKLGASDQSKAADKTALVMRMYGAMFSVAAHITGALRPLIAGLFLALGIVGIVPLFLTNTFVLRVLALLGVASLMVSFLTWSSQLTDRLATYFTAKSEVGRKGVGDVKKELGVLLRALENNLLVVIDDIDRLTPESVRMVFQLVKANADFPNVVYLLLFQRDVVEKVLSGDGQLDGPQFLDKVIQVGFDIPKLSAEKLENTLQTSIGSIVEQSPANQHFDSARWTSLFLSGIRPYFRTLRDVKRITNTLNFLFEMYREGEAFDVNPVDLIALEILRQFEPSVYHRLHDESMLVTGALTYEFSKTEKKDAEVLFTNAKHPDHAKVILEELFPAIARVLAESDVKIDSISADALLSDLRVCHADMFERYFKFSLGEEDLSEAEIASVLEVAGDRHDFVSKLRALNERHLLTAFLTRLRVDQPLIPPSRIESFITGLFDIEKELAAQSPRRGKVNVSLEQRALFIIRSLLRRASERGAVLKNAVGGTTGLYLPLLMFGGPKEESDRLVSEQVEEDLREESIRKIRAAGGELLSHPKLKDLLFFWSTRGPVEEAPNWVTSQLDSDTGLLALLRGFTESAAEITGQYIMESRYRFAIEAFARYADPVSLKKRVLHLANAPNLSTNDVMVCRLFLRAVAEYKKGPILEAGGPPDYSKWATIEDLAKDSTPEAV